MSESNEPLFDARVTALLTTAELAELRRIEDGCCCRERLIDYVRGTVSHPFTACPHHGATTSLRGADAG